MSLRRFAVAKWLPFMLPTMLYVAALTIFPTVFLAYLSLFHWVLSEPAMRYVGLRNWQQILSSPSLYYSFGLTIIFAVFVTSIELLLAIAFAVLMKNGGRFGRLVQNFVIVPLMMTPMLIMLLWKYIYATALGPGFYLATLLGNNNPAFLSAMPNAILSIALVDIWQWTPFCILVVLAGLYAFPESIHEASQLDGATGTQEFWHMILPYLKPFVGIVILFRLTDALKTFEPVMVLTGGGPIEQTQLASFYIWFHGLGRLLSVGDSAVLGILMVAMVMGITFAIMIIFRRSWR
jgi:multiple sugar transport system permease protein